MAGFLNISSGMMCPHGGTVNVITANSRAQAGGGYALRSSDTFLIAGCTFMIGTVPHPCVQVKWVQSALHNRAVNDFMLTEESVGLCLAPDMAAQGTVIITFTQPQSSGI